MEFERRPLYVSVQLANQEEDYDLEVYVDMTSAEAAYLDTLEPWTDLRFAGPIMEEFVERIEDDVYLKAADDFWFWNPEAPDEAFDCVGMIIYS